MTRVNARSFAVTGAALLVAGVGVAAPATAATGGGNQACRAGFSTLKIDRAPVLGETITKGTFSVTITDVDLKADGSGEAYGFSFTSSGASKVYVIVKGGPDSNVHPVGETTDLDTSLSPGGRHYGISNVKFCYKG
jgi:hypothetical protein